MSKRQKTEYPGVFFRMVRRIGGRGDERVFYVTFKRDGQKIEEKAGRQFSDGMTPSRAARIRADFIEGRRETTKEAREAEAAAAAEEKYTIGRLWDEYKAQRPDSKNLRIDACRFEKYIKKPFGDKAPADLIPLDIDRMRIALLKKLSPQSVAHILGLLRRVVKFGADKGLCAGTGFKIKLPRVSNEKTEDLTPAQLEGLLAAIDASEHITAKAMMKLALFTGMRRGEMFKLQWRDVDHEKGFIMLRDPKGGPDQKIPLNDEARGLLEAHPRSKGSLFVFPGRHGCQLTDIHKQVNAIRDAAGLPATFRALHGLRHVYASLLASSGRVDLYTIQKLLTHKSSKMTARYAHLSDAALARASNVASDIIAKAAKPKAEVKKITRGKK